MNPFFALIRRLGPVLGGFAAALLTPFPLPAAKVLPQEEAAAGWIHLFDGETLFGWNPLGDVTWTVDAEGRLIAEKGTGGWIATSSQFADFELIARIRLKSESTAGLAVRAGLEGHPSENGSTVIPLREPQGDPPWREIRVKAEGPSVEVTVDGRPVEIEPGARRRGYIGVLFHTYHRRPENRVEIAEVKLRPLNMKPIFNGRDLSEWNILPDRKSKFAVVDGAINITDGNGQIETKGVYKDFVLQLDIISNGEHLNSGVFFRGPVGVFWKGYESQVRNQWSGDDRTRPVDFGTGGNYGNQPARVVIPSDHQWFTKTIIVDGPHAAIWVNGYLVSDFTDLRSISREDDGKNGYVPGPGTIHLQGHDPTTNLSFKNIRIQEYPAP